MFLLDNTHPQVCIVMFKDYTNKRKSIEKLCNIHFNDYNIFISPHTNKNCF